MRRFLFGLAASILALVVIGYVCRTAIARRLAERTVAANLSTNLVRELPIRDAST